MPNLNPPWPIDDYVEAIHGFNVEQFVKKAGETEFKKCYEFENWFADYDKAKKYATEMAEMQVERVTITHNDVPKDRPQRRYETIYPSQDVVNPLPPADDVIIITKGMKIPRHDHLIDEVWIGGWYDQGKIDRCALVKDGMMPVPGDTKINPEMIPATYGFVVHNRSMGDTIRWYLRHDGAFRIACALVQEKDRPCDFTDCSTGQRYRVTPEFLASLKEGKGEPVSGD